MHHFQPTAVNYLFLPSICIGLGIADAKWQNILELQAALGSDGMHRADIDGLRAVAVVSVVLFHFKLFPNYIRGGFVGVDVFVSGRPLSQYAAEYRRTAQKEINLAFAKALKKEGIEYFSTYEAIRNPECMIWTEEGVPLQFDDGHLTRQGSAYVARKFGRQVL